MSKMTTKMGLRNCPQGSIWRRWDLQVHTPESHLNNGFGDDWDSYVTCLFRKAIDNNIAAIGITDYFTIDGYIKLQNEYLGNAKKLESLFSPAEIESIRGILILPNIEFRLRPIAGQRINFHVIFSDEVSASDIEEHFLHDLEFTYEGEPQQSAAKKKLKLSNIEALGKKLRSQHKNFEREGNDLFIGMKNAVVDEQQIVSLLDNERDRFRGKYLVGVVSDEDLSELSWDGQDHQTRKVLIQMSDLLFASNPKTVAWACGNESVYKEGPEKFVEEFRTLKPCVHGSDSHKDSELFHPCANRGDEVHSCESDPENCDLRNCWIKADATFEGLKQVVYEPQYRIRICKENPAPLKSSYSIANYKIDQICINKELAIKSTDIPLNSDLVAVIGGRGRGKTAFVDLLAHNFSDQRSSKNKNSFVQRLGNEANSLQTTIRFANEECFFKKLADGSFCNDGSIVYIAQGDLELYLGEEFDQYVHGLVFSQMADTVLGFEFDTIVNELLKIEDELERVLVQASKLVSETHLSKKEKFSHEVKLARAKLKDTIAKISAFEQRNDEKQLAVARQKQQKLAELRERLDLLKEALKVADECQAFIKEDLPKFNSSIGRFREILERLKTPGVLPKLEYPGETNLVEKIAELKLALNAVVKDIEKFQTEILKEKNEVAKHTKLLDQKGSEEKQIKTLESALEQFEADKETLAASVESRHRLLEKLLGKVLDQKRKYDAVIYQFAKDKDKVLSDINFEAEIQFDTPRVLNSLDELLDSRRINVLKLDSEDSALRGLVEAARQIEGWNPEDDPSAIIENYVAEVSKLESQLPDKIRKAEGIDVLDFYKALYRKYFSVSPQVKYKQTDLRNLSLGQKSTVLIKIYLAQGDEPIIIDSHDDYLDNEFIMDELVQAIRKAKEYRQVILVSNNGNLVINSDAEQVIIAERDDSGSIFYQSGSLENPQIRDRSLKVLEGGRLAFQKREQKYRLSIQTLR